MAEILSINKNGKINGNNPFKNAWEFFWSLDKFTKIALFTGLLIILITPFFVSNYLETRQRASGEAVSVYFTRRGETTPLTSLSLTPGQQVTLDFYLATGTTNVNGLDITATLSNTLLTTQPGQTAGADATRFNVPLFDRWTNNTWRFAKVSTNTGTPNVGIFYLASIPFMAGTTTGNGTIDFPRAMVTSPQSTTALTVGKQSLAYTVALSVSGTPPVSQGTFTFIGNVFIDTNRNGTKQDTESCYAGSVNVSISVPNITPVTYTQTADCNSAYRFDNLPAGRHTVTIQPITGHSSTHTPPWQQTITVP